MSPNSFSTSTWWVPLTYTKQKEPDFNATRPQLWLENVQSTVVEDLPDNKSWVVFNVHETGLFFLVNNQRDAQILFHMFISIYNSLNISSTQCSSSGETNCINTASGNSHSMLVAEMCAGWKNSSSNLHTSRAGVHKCWGIYTGKGLA